MNNKPFMPVEVADQLVYERYRNYHKLLKNGRERDLRDTLYRMWLVAKLAWLENGGCEFMYHEIEDNNLQEMAFRGWIRILELDKAVVIWLTRTGRRVLGIA